jgi:hypothetical protein
MGLALAGSSKTADSVAGATRVTGTCAASTKGNNCKQQKDVIFGLDYKQFFEIFALLVD